MTTFTVAKRTADIALRPGWNLISIPGSLAPDKRAVNDVFTNGAIDIVLTYDAGKRNWFRATRQADGSLGQPGSSLELGSVSSRTAYWVHATGVVTQAVDLLGASSQEPPVSIDMVAGWNLVPVRTTEVGSDPVDADSYLSGLRLDKGVRIQQRDSGVPVDPAWLGCDVGREQRLLGLPEGSRSAGTVRYAP